jgi:hypothetical protein
VARKFRDPNARLHLAPALQPFAPEEKAALMREFKETREVLVDLYGVVSPEMTEFFHKRYSLLNC